LNSPFFKNQKPFRIKQFYNAIFCELIESIDAISVFPQDLKNSLSKLPLFVLKIEKINASQDKKTFKALFRTQDNQFIESVLIRHQEKRNTVCVSSQIGCSGGCLFCATGKMGLLRNLSTQEIIEQVLFWNRFLKKEYLQSNPSKKWDSQNPPHLWRVNNLVFMGMGEPLFNLENVLASIEIFKDKNKFNLSSRHISISTIGIIPQIEKLATLKPPVRLAISLHASNDSLRSRFIPLNRQFPLSKLLPVLWEYARETKKRIFFEYVVIRDLNDQPVHAEELGKLLQKKPAHVNLILLNENPSLDVKFKKPKLKNVIIMQNILKKYEVTSTIRSSFGEEILAACGQLATQSSSYQKSSAKPPMQNKIKNVTISKI
jgi:23S rRNA (adenine2503-C2)-methyltransferase